MNVSTHLSIYLPTYLSIKLSSTYLVDNMTVSPDRRRNAVVIVPSSSVQLLHPTLDIPSSRHAITVLQLSSFSHHRAIVIVHSSSSHCSHAFVMPPSSLHCHHTVVVMDSFTCRHRFVVITLLHSVVVIYHLVDPSTSLLVSD